MAYDLGDPVTLTINVKDSAGALANATLVTLTITAPDGTSTTATVTPTTTGVYQHSYVPATAGRYLTRWVATGSNASAFTDVFDVLAVQPAPLITVAELEEHVGRALDAGLAAAAVRTASGLIRGHTRQGILAATYTGAKIPVTTGPHGFRIVLPQRPVLTVSSVTVWGTAMVEDKDWAWDGITQFVEVDELPDEPAGKDLVVWPPTATVTYRAGYVSVPADVAAVACAAAARIIENPRGLRSRSIGDYSETFAGADDTVAGVTLLDAERRALHPYRLRAGSLVVQ